MGRNINPQLLGENPIVYNYGILKKIGIDLGELKQLPKGFIKLYPEDFIVEEVTPEGEVCTVEKVPGDLPPNAEKKEFLGATLVKRGMNTIQAARILAGGLDLPLEAIKWAGIKDAVAVTSQRITIKKPDLEKIEEFKNEGVFLKEFSFADGKILFGDLTANRFTIFVRTEWPLKEEEFSRKVDWLEKEGALNFYGPQRFTTRLIGHLAGREFFKDNFAEGIKIMLTAPGVFESPAARDLRNKARALWGNWPAMLKLFKPFRGYFKKEILILGHLIKKSEDFITPLIRLREGVRLNCYSYQNYLFNRLLSAMARRGEEIPETLPMVDDSPETRKFYKKYLEEDGLENLKSFKIPQFFFVIIKPRQVKTRLKSLETVRYKVLPEGAFLRFSLPPAAYATSFLMGLFVLFEGYPPPFWVGKRRYSVEKILGYFEKA